MIDFGLFNTACKAAWVKRFYFRCRLENNSIVFSKKGLGAI